MGQVTRTGMHFGALARPIVLSKDEATGKIQAEVVLNALSWFNPLRVKEEHGGWIDCVDEAAQSRGWFSMHSKDGKSKNMTIVAMLMEAFGWDGKTLKGLTEIPVGTLCQFDMRAEEYQGKKTLKMKWIYFRDYVAPVEQVDVGAMDAAWGGLPGTGPAAPAVSSAGSGAVRPGGR